jgi:hypothetical protein
MLHTSIEKMTTYIGTKYSDEAAQEWTSGKKINILEPAYSQTIQDRHAARVRTTREQMLELSPTGTCVQTHFPKFPLGRVFQ